MMTAICLDHSSSAFVGYFYRSDNKKVLEETIEPDYLAGNSL